MANHSLSRARISGQDGIAMITVMLVLILMSALLVGFTAVVMSDQRFRYIDRDRNRAFYAASAGVRREDDRRPRQSVPGLRRANHRASDRADRVNQRAEHQRHHLHRATGGEPAAGESADVVSLREGSDDRGAQARRPAAVGTLPAIR